MKKIFLISAASLGLALGLGAASAGSEAEEQPPSDVPPFVRDDGTIDASKVPDRIPVLNENGEITGYMDSDEFLSGPTLTPSEAVEVREALPDAQRGTLTTDPEDGSVIEEVTPILPGAEKSSRAG